MVKRRKSKDELAEELQTEHEKKRAQAEREDTTESDSEADAAIGGGDAPVERSESDAGENGPGSGPGDFTAITAAQIEEVNELFNLVNGAGYLTIGSYNVQADGEGNLAVTLTAITPSSGGTPDEITGGGGGDDVPGGGL